MPIHAPLIPTPFVPYECKNNRMLFALCKGNEEQIKNYLAPTPFEYVSNDLLLSITDFMNCDKVPFMDCAVAVPVKYQDTFGGYYLFEYENHDSAIAAGRELWGYPKKYADISLVKNGSVMHGKAVRQNKTVIELTCDLSQVASEQLMPVVTPHLNIRMIPRADGKGIEMMQLLSRDTSPDFQKKSEQWGQTSVSVTGLSTDPIDQLGPLQVMGGGFIIGDFYATEENGWGTVLETKKINKE